MASLFDLAAELSQFGLAPNERESVRAESPKRHRQSALSILDETLQTIFDSSARSAAPPTLPLGSPKSREQLDSRLRALHLTRPAVKLQKVYAHSVSYPTLPRHKPQAAADATAQQQQQLAESCRNRGNANGRDPDLVAKSVLRDISDEMDQIAQLGLATPDNLVRRYLMENDAVRATGKAESGAEDRATRAAAARRTSNCWRAQQQQCFFRTRRCAVEQAGIAVGAAARHAANAAACPRSASGQQELVQFAKRYDRLLRLSEQEICKLPLQHQHIVRNLQQQAQA